MNIVAEPATSLLQSSRETENPFVCNVCKRSYTRIDHLARHYRSHTQEKLFSCAVCSKDFSRADLLKRHAGVHIDDPERKRAKRDAQSGKSSRVSHACSACAAAKIRCQEEKPCRRCQSRNLHCTVDSGLNSHSSHSSFQGSSNVSLPSTDPQQGKGGEEHVIQPEPELVETEMSRLFPDQLPTPVTLDQTVTNHGLQEQPSIPDITDDTYLAEFLRDIMMPDQINPQQQNANGGYGSGIYTPRDVMDFGISTSFNLEDFHIASFTTFEEMSPNLSSELMLSGQIPISYESHVPDVENSMDMGSAAFRRSVWRWTPTNERGNAEQLDLACDTNETAVHPRHLRMDSRSSEHHLDHKGRDKILGVILDNCDSVNISKIVSSFPSVGVLDCFLHGFFQSLEIQRDSWIHIPTLRPNSVRQELISIMVAAGAVLSPVPKVRRLGYAIEESVRLSIPKMFEHDNSLTRDLPALQAYALQLGIGVWSGDKRKMEIAESHMLPLVTMLRRAGYYRRPIQASPSPLLEDIGEELTWKWKNWIKAESFKRLAFHTFILASQVSMALLVPPLIPYAEMSLDFPAPDALWQAKTAEEWRDAYLSVYQTPGERCSSLVQCIYNVDALENHRHRVDLPFTVNIILHGFWNLIWDHRQMSSTMKLQAAPISGNGRLISSSWHHELCQLLQRLRSSLSNWQPDLPDDTAMLLELLSMNLHVSFEELQLLAGKQGEEEARRAFPALKQWVTNQSSREAVWHAGQLLRVAHHSSRGVMRDFYVVALYHAGLAFWVYGIVSRAIEREKPLRPTSDGGLVWLDGTDLQDRHRFVDLQRGVPVIKDRRDEADGSSAVQLSDPKAVMDDIIAVMKSLCNKDSGSLSPLVENLMQLMRDLGNAAWAMGRT